MPAVRIMHMWFDRSARLVGPASCSESPCSVGSRRKSCRSMGQFIRLVDELLLLLEQLYVWMRDSCAWITLVQFLLCNRPIDVFEWRQILFFDHAGQACSRARMCMRASMCRSHGCRSRTRL